MKNLIMLVAASTLLVSHNAVARRLGMTIEAPNNLGSTVTMDEEMMLSGRHFEMVTVEDPPWVIVREDRFNATSKILPPDQWHGYALRFLDEVSRLANFTYALRLPGGPAPNGGVGKANSYGLACNDVYYNTTYDNGAKDAPVVVYWSVAYITTPRLENSIQTSPFMEGPLSLLATAVEPSFGDRIGKLSGAFKPEVWFLSIGFMFFVSVAFLFLDPTAGDFKQHVGGGVGQTMTNFAKSLFMSFLTFKANDTFSTKTTAGMMLSSAWTLLGLVLMAAFTAELVDVLTRAELIFEHQSFQEFADSGLSVCVLADTAYSRWMAGHEVYSKIKQVPLVGGMPALLSGLAAKQCDGVVDCGFKLQFAVNSGAFCSELAGKRVKIVDVMMDGLQVLAPGFKLGMEEEARKMSYWIQKLRASAVAEQMYQLTVDKGGCPDPGVQPLSVRDLAGPLLLFGVIFLFVAIVVGKKHLQRWLAIRRHGTFEEFVHRWRDKYIAEHPSIKEALDFPKLDAAALKHRGTRSGSRRRLRRMTTLDGSDSAMLMDTQLIKQWASDEAIREEAFLPVFMYIKEHMQLREKIHPSAWHLCHRAIKALAKLDLDGDGTVDADDVKAPELRPYLDLSMDGIVSPAEMDKAEDVAAILSSVYANLVEEQEGRLVEVLETWRTDRIRRKQKQLATLASVPPVQGLSLCCGGGGSGGESNTTTTGGGGGGSGGGPSNGGTAGLNGTRLAKPDEGKVEMTTRKVMNPVARD